MFCISYKSRVLFRFTLADGSDGMASLQNSISLGVMSFWATSQHGNSYTGKMACLYWCPKLTLLITSNHHPLSLIDGWNTDAWRTPLCFLYVLFSSLQFGEICMEHLSSKLPISRYWVYSELNVRHCSITADRCTREQLNLCDLCYVL